jgi:hypothetical protein
VLRPLAILLVLITGAVVLVSGSPSPVVSEPPATTSSPDGGIAAPVPGVASAKLTKPDATSASVERSVEEALATAKRTGFAVPFAFTLADSELTRAAAISFPQSFAGATVSDPQVTLDGGRITLNAKASTFFGKSALVAVATPYLSGGKLATRVDSASIAGIGLPSAVRTTMADQLQAGIDAQLPPRFKVNPFSISRGTITLTGIALP